MYILFEEHQYKLTDNESVLPQICHWQNVDGKYSTGFVGYFFEPKVNDCVFILPKVLLNENEMLVTDKGELVDPANIISPEGQDEYLTDNFKRFLYEFAVWIYRSVSVFHQKNPHSNNLLYCCMPQSGVGKRHKANTYLDVILSLIRFNQENQDFFFFIAKNVHSGYNKINWTRTISHSQAFAQNGVPVYINPVNRKREVNFDEELFVIFFSILDYVNREYGFQAPICLQYELLSKLEFGQYMKGKGRNRLRQIRYRYFSDKAVLLWELCYAFFDSTYQLAVNTQQKEYLLVKSFDVVFEAIIDELLGDKNLPPKLKAQKDGKLIDHLYNYTSLTENDLNTYYIGDSKYYKRNTKIQEKPEYKQYTYARNLTQWNLDYFREGGQPTDKVLPLRDELTEGYNVVPNFFISAKMEPDLSSKDTIELSERQQTSFSSLQFLNRLFDRDTHLVLHYDVNFLYVVTLYARNRSGEKAAWKTKVRAIFRTKIRKELEGRYQFYVMTARPGVDEEKTIKENFQTLLGKVFTPYDMKKNRQFYSLALAEPDRIEMKGESERQKIAEENEEVLNLVGQYFYVEPCHLGDDPYEKLKDKIQSQEERVEKTIGNQSFITIHYLENYLNDYVLIGHVKDKEHLDWIFSKFTDYKFKKNGHRQPFGKYSNIYNVRCGSDREGAIKRTQKGTSHVRFVVLCDCDDEKIYGVYRAEYTSHIFTNKQMSELKYTNPDGPYRCYILEEEVSIGDIDISRLIADKQYEKYAPIYLTAEELIKYRT